MRFVLFVVAVVLGVTGLRTSYDYVARQIASPDISARIDFHGTPVPPPDLSAINQMMAKPVPGVPDGFASSIATQNQQFNDRMEDLRNYARNPAGWHGAPPQ